MNISKKIIPTPEVVVPKLSRLEVREELGVMYILVDGDTRLCMPTDQAISFGEFLLKRAYQIQLQLNVVQQKKGDPTAHCKRGGANLTTAISDRVIDQIEERIRERLIR